MLSKTQLSQTTNSLAVFLVRRAKRAREENSHTCEAEGGRGAKKERLLQVIFRCKILMYVTVPNRTPSFPYTPSFKPQEMFSKRI